MKAPAIFISHGSPMNLIDDNNFTNDLKNFAKNLEKPKGIISVSAHWYGEGLKVSTAKKNETIYDFYGFPRELYEMKYEPVGLPEIASKVAERIGGFEESTMGVDHGTWAVLKYLFPKGDVPVFQVSVDLSQSYSWHYELGKKLREFREEGFIILGSGNGSHNLTLMKREVDAKPDDWVVEFSKDLKKGVLEDVEMLINPEERLANFTMAHNTVEHYLPLLTVLGSKFEDEKIDFIHERYQHGNLDMLSFRVS